MVAATRAPPGAALSSCLFARLPVHDKSMVIAIVTAVAVFFAIHECRPFFLKSPSFQEKSFEKLRIWRLLLIFALVKQKPAKQKSIMLSKILSVTGRPGLYKLVSTNQNMNIVEALSDGKRIPVYAQEKVVALSDVSIYTNDGDIPLRDVLKMIRSKEEGKQVSLGSKPSGNTLFTYFAGVLPDYSKESVYANDVKKIISWYNLLVEHDIDFEEEELEETSSETGDEAEKEDTVEKDSGQETGTKKEDKGT